MFSDSPHDEAVPIWQRVVSYASYFVLWLTYTAITFWLVFQIEDIFIVGAMRLRLNPWQVRAVDKFSLVFLGLVWLASMFLVESYLRNGIAQRKLMRRAGRVYLGLAIFSLVVIGVNRLV